MKKVIVIGCPGAGKSTFARELHKKTGLPLFYLDMIWHKPDKTSISREEFDQRIEEYELLEKHSDKDIYIFKTREEATEYWEREFTGE